MRLRLLPTLATLAALGCTNPVTEAQLGGNGGGAHASSAARRAGGSSSGGSAPDAGGSRGGTGGSSSTTGAAAPDGGTGGTGAAAFTGSTSLGGGTTGGGGGTTGSPGGMVAAAVCGSNLPDAGGNITDIAFNCANVPFYAGDAGDCPGGWLGSYVVDFELCSPVCGAQVQAVTPAGVPIAGTNVVSDPVSGAFHFCVPPGTVFETEVNEPGYPTFYYGEVDTAASVNLPSFGILSIDELTVFANLVQPPIDLTQAGIVTFLVEEDGCPEAEPGWTEWLTDEDGGLYPDGGYALSYIAADGFPDPTLTATSSFGVAIFYNIDPTVATFPTLHYSRPADAGVCQVVNSQVGFTGRVEVGAGVFSEQGLFLEF